VPSPLPRLLAYAGPHRREVLWATACSVLNKLWDLAPPVLIGAAVDVVVKREDSLLASWGLVDPAAQLTALAIGTVIIWGLESVFEYLYQNLWRNLAQTLEHELRLDAYGHVQDLDLAWYSEQPRGALLAVLNDDVNQLERFLDGGANDLLQVGTTVVVVSLVFFGISPALAALAMLPIPVILWGSFVFQRRIAPRYARVRESVAALSALLTNNLAGITTIKAFVAEERELERLAVVSEAYRSANREAIRLSASFIPLVRMAIVVGFVATLVHGGNLALRGELAVGAYSVLVFLTQRLLWPLTRLGATVDLYQRAMASTARILDLIDTPVTIVEGERELTAPRGEITFEGVTFAYPDRDPVLTDFNLTIPAGSTLGVVGSTGSGKTTLVRLLLRFFDTQAGRVLLDGVDVRELRLSSLRGSVAYVGQQVFLFPGTVAENIRYGRPDADDADVQQAAAQAEATGFVEALPGTWDAPIGEGGNKLSGGQRQRLSIARAVLEDAPVLVLDEATSAVDNETEAAIQRSLARVGEGRTVVAIAHRLSTIRRADRIVVMEQGRIVESGTHEELLAAAGRYAALWAVQTGEGAA